MTPPLRFLLAASPLPAAPPTPPTPAPPPRRRRRGPVPLMGAVWVLTLLPPGLAGQAPVAPGLPGPVVARTLPTGSQLWVLRMPGAQAVALELVFPAGVAPPRVDGPLRECPRAEPTLGPGPDFQVLSLRGSPSDVFACLGALRASEPDDDPGDTAPVVGRGASGPVFDAVGGAPTAVSTLLETLYGPGGLEWDGAGAAASGGPSHLVLVGDLEVEEAVRRVGEALRLPAPESRAGGPERPRTAPVATEVLVLDLPGAPLAELQVGELLLPADHPDWPALVVARELLARRLSGPGAEGAWGYVELVRLRGTGAFLAGSRIPAPAAAEAVASLSEAASALRDRLLPAEVVRAVVDSVGVDFTEAVRTPDGAARQLARAAALGLGPEAVDRYPARLAAVDPEAVRRAVRGHLDPSRFVVVAAGDAAALTPLLAPFGPVRRVDAPEPPASWPRMSVDGRVLSATVLTYRVLVGTREVGRAVRTVTLHPPDSLRIVARAELGDGRTEQAVTATLPNLEFRSGTTTGSGAGADLRRVGDRLVGALPGVGRIDLPLLPGTVVADLLEPSLWAAELAPSGRYRVPVATRDGSAVRWAGIRVSGPEAVTVPAGTFEALRVDVTGPESMTVWVLPEAPHLTLRLAAPTGVVVELVDRDPGPPPRAGGPDEPPFPP